MKKTVEEVIKIRQEGKTYKEISEITKLAKSSISYICKKYISDNSIIVNNNCKKNYTSFLNNKKRQKLARIKADEYYNNLRLISKNKWLKLLNKVSLPFLYYCKGLYDGEGNHSGTEFSFSNSDKYIISKWIYFLSIIEAKWKSTLSIHKTHDKKLCINYWSSILDKEPDKINQFDNRKQKKYNKYRKNYGTINIRVYKPLGLREALLELCSALEIQSKRSNNLS